MPLSLDLRTRIIDAWKTRQFTYEQLAERFSVGRASVDRLINLFRETGSVEPRPRGGGNPPHIPDEMLEVFRAVVDAAPDNPLPVIAESYRKRTGVTVHPMTVRRALARIGYSRKKSHWSPPNARARR